MTDAHFMQMAVAEGRRGLGRTGARPSVGAVIVTGSRVFVARTTDAGVHAEPAAIAAAAGADLRGATLYCTLEPCNHHGRTPPCTDAILAAGLSRVVIGTIDPFGSMNGRSVELLRAAGVQVVVGVEEGACRALHRAFLRAVERGLPEVTLKVATSLDGRIGTATGESKWITGEAARERGRAMRAEHDAVLVGIGTVLADDPRLTARIDGAPEPVPVVLDTNLRIPVSARLLSERSIVICAEDAPERELRGQVIRLARGDDGRIDVTTACRALVVRGVHRVMVEGGGGVHRSFLDAGLVDKLAWFTAGVVLPGGVPAIGGAPLHELAAARRFVLRDVERIGDDVLMVWELGT